MNDIKNAEWAPWLEGVLQQLVEMNPKKIAIAVICEDGTTGTQYYNVNASDCAIIAGTIQQDGLFARIEANADWLKGIVDSAEEEEE